jgi:hypothetical protein
LEEREEEVPGDALEEVAARVLVARVFLSRRDMLFCD